MLESHEPETKNYGFNENPGSEKNFKVTKIMICGESVNIRAQIIEVGTRNVERTDGDWPPLCQILRTP